MANDIPTDYTFLLQCTPHPSTVPRYAIPGFFFNEYEHLLQQQDGLFYLLSAVNQWTGQADARCAFFSSPTGALSPAAAPFGSIEFIEALPVAVLDTFVDTLINALDKLGLSRIRLVHYPRCYAPQQTDRLTAVLARHTFRLVENYPTSFIPITNEVFSGMIVPAERRRLRKCREAGFTVASWQSSDVTELITFIQYTRRQQGYSLSIKPDQLTGWLSKFPGQFSVFTVCDGTTLVALAVTVRVRHDILYSFLPASHPAYRTFSPMVMLIDRLFSYCREQRIQLLDLGVSLGEDRQPKPGLLRFKHNLGAQESPKYIFEKTIGQTV